MKKTTWVILALLAVAGSLFIKSCGTDSGLKTVFEVAQARDLPDLIPTGSAVCFSSRWKRPQNPSDPHDTFRDAARFYATHMMWVYVRDTEFIREAKAKGYVFQSSLNTVLDGRSAGFKPEEGRVMDAEGNLITAPWMASWQDVWWGCVNSDEYRKIYLHHAMIAVEGGTDLLHMDDPGLNYAVAVNWGGCYCKYCRKGFEEFKLKNPDATMVDFQEESVKRFYTDMWREIDSRSEKYIPKSSNNYRGQFRFFYHKMHDFGVAEFPDIVPESFIESQRQSLKLGKAQVITATTESVDINRRSIAMASSTGMSMIVPWDVYMGSKPRYFGTPEEYADLYGFIRGCAEILDGYEHAGVFSAAGDSSDLYEGEVPVQVIGSDQVFASIRVVPGNKRKPAIIHLVDWSENPGAFELLINPDRFYGKRKVRIELWTPAPYDAEVHDIVAKTNDFAPLVQKRTIASGDIKNVSIEKVEPWGILVLFPL